MHHIAYRVDDLLAALAQLQAQGVWLIDEQPRPGLHGSLVAFVHPKAAMGVLIELVQHPARSPHQD
jgi:methylmalonyl-CoA/ethylmalonyl-CoA epimerase